MAFVTMVQFAVILFQLLGMTLSYDILSTTLFQSAHSVFSCGNGSQSYLFHVRSELLALRGKRHVFFRVIDDCFSD